MKMERKILIDVYCIMITTIYWCKDTTFLKPMPIITIKKQKFNGT